MTVLIFKICDFAAFGTSEMVPIAIRRVCKSAFMEKLSWLYFETFPALFVSLISKVFCTVKFCMINVCHNLEISDRIIQSIMIDMMNEFIAFQFSSKKFLHNMSMLIDWLPIYKKSSVAFICDATATSFCSKLTSMKRVAMTLKSMIVRGAKFFRVSFLPTIRNSANSHIVQYTIIPFGVSM